MKITIDLNDPNIARQIETAIEAKLNELVAGKIQGVVDSVLATKTERLSDKWIAEAVNRKLEERIAAAFQSTWTGANDFRRVLAEVTEKVLREHLAK